MKMNLLKLSSLVIAMMILLALTGCSVGGQDEMLTKNNDKMLITDVNKALPYPNGIYQWYWGPYTDWSNQVEVKYYYNSVEGYLNTAAAVVPEDSVCIGGGAYTDFDGNPGFLTASWPGNDNRTWLAQSKDHIYPGYHKQTAIAVGLRLKDAGGNYIPVEKVKEHFKINSSHGVDINKNEDLISGGSMIADPFIGTGQLLHWNIINNMIYWSSASRSHIYEDPKQVVSYTVAYDHKYIEGFGYLHISADFVSADFTGSNKGTVIILPSNGWVMAGVGGATYVKDRNLATGRMLTGMGFWNYPSGFYGFAKDTDFINPASGRLTVNITQIQKDRRANIQEGNYYIRNRWTGEYMFDGYISNSARHSISIGSTKQSWNIKAVKFHNMYFTIRNNVTNKYIKQNFLDYDGGEYEFWRNSTDPNIQNSTDPNGYFSIGTFDSYNFLHIENRLGYVQSTKRRDLNSGWWSKDWYLEPAY